jgi:hypothetical protein
MPTRLLLSAAALIALTSAAAPLSPSPPDPRIQAMVAQVSPVDLKAYDTRLVGFGTRNDFSERSSTAQRGVFAARDWIRKTLEGFAKASGGRMTVALNTYVQPKTARTPRAVTESSIIATLRGAQPGRTYVMSSHYDDCNGDCTNGTRNAPGADDNGSGTSAVIEAAKVMARHHFRGTIVFAIFDGEELGLWGSNHFARQLKAQGTDVVADLNNDIIGTPNAPAGSPDSFRARLFSEALPVGTDVERTNELGTENDSPSRELARFVKSTAQRYVPSMKLTLIYRSDRFLRGGDQQSFAAQGFPAVRFVETHENFKHQHQNVRLQNGVQYGDLPQYIDPPYLARVTQMNVAALAALALGPEQPPNAQIVVKRLTNRSTLRWQRAADAVSYEIVWRATTSPVWQFAKNVGNVTEATVPVSKDDNILGVRSVDAHGLRSPVAYPSPTRT